MVTEGPDPHSCTRSSLGVSRRRAIVELVDHSALVSPVQRAAVSGLLSTALEHLGVSGEVRIRFVNDAEMSVAHARYCSDPSTTDVLTFDLSSPSDREANAAAELDIDLLLCVDEARRQATSRGLELEHELLLYAVHGVLHCLGHDDHDEDEARRMHEREDEILQAIGVGKAFSVSPREAAVAADGMESGVSR